MAPTVAYWDFPARAEPIKLVLIYSGVEFIDKSYSKGSDGKGSGWFDQKFNLGFDFPNLPYYIDGDVKLTHTSAILRYLARKYNLYGSNEADRIRIDVLEQQLNDVFYSFREYAFKLAPVNEEEVLAKVDAQLKELSNFLGNRKYVTGEAISYVDFWYLTVLGFLLRDEKVEKLFDKYENLGQLMGRIAGLPKVKEHLEKHEGKFLKKLNY